MTGVLDGEMLPCMLGWAACIPWGFGLDMSVLKKEITQCTMISNVSNGPHSKAKVHGTIKQRPVSCQHTEKVRSNRSTPHNPPAFNLLLCFLWLPSKEQQITRKISTLINFFSALNHSFFQAHSLANSSLSWGKNGEDGNFPVQGCLEHMMGSQKGSRWRKRPWHCRGCRLLVYYCPSLKSPWDVLAEEGTRWVQDVAVSKEKINKV